MTNFKRSITLTLLVLLSGSGCFLSMKKDLQPQSSDAVQAPEVGTVGLKNIHQVAPSMAAVTGIPLSTMANAPSNLTLGEEAAQVRSWFSPDGNALTVTGSMQLVAVGLAGQFCSKLVSTEAATATGSRKFFNLIDFTAAVTAITTAAQVDVANRLFRNILKRDPSAEEVLIIKDAFADAAATAVGSDRSPARSALVACTSVLGSIEFLGNN